MSLIQELENGSESSGIIEVFDIFGKGYWLLDIQAHTLGEGGQLLLMNIPGS